MPWQIVGTGGCAASNGSTIYTMGYSWVGATATTNTCRETCESDLACLGYQQSGTQTGVGGTGNCQIYNREPGGIEPPANNGWDHTLCYKKVLLQGTAVLNPDEAQRSYSSVHGNAAPGSGDARSILDSANAWCSANVQVGEWMQIDLGEPMLVVGVVTQGRSSDTGYDQWVSSYRVEYSLNGAGFLTVAGTWNGNSDSNTRVISVFYSSYYARYVRIFPLNWTGHPSMRAGVLRSRQADDGWYDGGLGQSCDTGCASHGLVCTEEELFQHNSDVDSSSEVLALITAMFRCGARRAMDVCTLQDPVRSTRFLALLRQPWHTTSIVCVIATRRRRLLPLSPQL
jgi:hypothetical protein